MAHPSPTASRIQSSLDSVTSDPSTGVPGLVFCAVSKTGKLIASVASGVMGLEAPEKPMTLDSVFWIASCTKMITGIACMQLVEQHKLSLDDPKLVYSICPELERMKVLDHNGKLIEREGDITLRMLLAHTAGFGYSFFVEKLRTFGRPMGYNEFSFDRKEFMSMPLVHQPGTKWEYGINIDWAGILVERVSGLTLDEYFKKYIFDPLGIKDITFFPTKEMKDNLVYMHQKFPDGTVAGRDHLARRPLAELSEEDKRSIMCAGGAGCFAKPKEYCKLITTLLNNGTSPTTGAQILKPNTVDEMFTNQIPNFPQFGRQGIPAAKKDLTNPIPNIYAEPNDPAQGWGLTFMLTSLEQSNLMGRGRNTGHWAGLANLFWWADREKGVGGMIASQILPFGDASIGAAWSQCEKAIYDGLLTK